MLMRHAAPESEIRVFVATHLAELKNLAGLAHQKLERPVVFVFDSKSLWTKASSQFALITGLPEEFFTKEQPTRYVTGYCSWELCQFAAMQSPEIREQLLTTPEEGKVRIVLYFSHGNVGYISTADIPIHSCHHY